MNDRAAEGEMHPSIAAAVREAVLAAGDATDAVVAVVDPPPGTDIDALGRAAGAARTTTAASADLVDGTGQLPSGAAAVVQVCADATTVAVLGHALGALRPGGSVVVGLDPQAPLDSLGLLRDLLVAVGTREDLTDSMTIDEGAICVTVGDRPAGAAIDLHALVGSTGRRALAPLDGGAA